MAGTQRASDKDKGEDRKLLGLVSEHMMSWDRSLLKIVKLYEAVFEAEEFVGRDREAKRFT